MSNTPAVCRCGTNRAPDKRGFIVCPHCDQPCTMPANSCTLCSRIGHRS